MVSSLFSAIPIATADPASGVISNFSDGSNSVSLQTSNISVSTVNLTIQRNTTIGDASFQITYDSNDPSPGAMTVDLDSDGLYEWHLGSTGDGQVGEQNEFSDGSTSTVVSANGNRTWLQAGSWRLPMQATMASSEITVGFTPDLGAQFSGVGAVSDLQVGDMDGDGIDDPIYLVQDHTGANGTSWPHIGWMKWTGTGLTTSWFATCADADELVLGDADGDGSTDILAMASEPNQLCQHLSGNSWNYSTNVSMSEKFEDAVLADLDGDSQDDLISIDADGTLAFRAFSAGSFSTPVTVTVPSGNQMTGFENFVHVDIGTFYGNNISVVVGENDMMTAYNTLWNFTANNWVVSMDEFECSAGPFEVFDWNSDGFDDIMGSTTNGACTATWNGTGWTTATSILVNLENYTVGDHDGDGVVDLFRPLEGTPDGSDSTQTGSVEMHTFNSNGAVNTNSTSFNPHTSPRAMAFADMDGDGLSEQIIAAGEATPGLFVGAWHTLEWDLESDSTIEMEMSGYANASNPLSESDEGLLITNVATELISVPVIYDPYETPWAAMSPVARSIGAGSITQSELNMTYTATFVVEDNPGYGNLSNVLNGFMLMGTGDIDIPINITSTRNGSVALDSLSIAWVEGAVNIHLPEPPVLTIFDYNYSQVSLMWTNSTSQSDLEAYQLFRAPTGNQFNFDQPLAETLAFGYQDSDAVTNQTWDYVVRSVHSDGIFSNLSNIVSVQVPDVPPVFDTTPPDAAIVTLADVPNDTGGVLNLSFTPSPSSDLAYTLIYLETENFTNASGLTPHANISSEDPTTSMLISGLTDGEQHWAAAVTVDGDDNAWWNVTTVGPIYSTNDTVRQSTLTLDVTGDGVYDDGTRTGVHVHAGSQFSISAQLSSEGAPLSNEELTVSVSFAGGTWTSSLTTGLTGIASQSWSDWSEFVDSWESHGGVGQVSVSWPGGTYGIASQSVSATSASADIISTVDATFSTTTPSVQLDSTGTGTASFTAITDDTSNQIHIDGLPINWQLGNGTEVQGESGSSQFDASGSASISIDFITGGWIDLIPTTPWWMSLSPASIRVDLYPPPTEGCTDPSANNFDDSAQVDDGSCTFDNPQLVFVDVSCDNDWQLLDNSTQTMASVETHSLECSLTNPNNVTIFATIDFVYSESTPTFTDDLSASEVPIASGESLVITVSPTSWTEGMDLENGTVRINVALTATGWDGVDDHWIVPYVIVDAEVIDQPSNDDDNTQGNSDASEGGTNLTLIIACVAIVLALLGFVGLRMAMREEEDEDAETFEDEEWERKPKKKIQTQPDLEDLPTGRSLDELTTRGSSVSMKKSKRVDRRAGVRPTDITEVAEEEPEPEAETEWDYTQDEDYHVDEEGVEWWKDEVGQWWYKYPDDDDWEAFEE
ncbi:MAG: hypothetical protein VYA86_03840 [Candidatus Thermoplasmatota archaeon]|nr:hypothetical protein [Candidatus Thermoplasmatota archaeon]